MKKESESLTAADFFEKLQQDKLDTAIPFSIIGMVKKSEGKEKTIEFAPGGNCSNWVTIPLELIEDVEMMKTIACKDHTHPLVKLNMKTPETVEGKIFFALLEGVKHANEGKQHNYGTPPSMQMNSKQYNQDLPPSLPPSQTTSLRFARPNFGSGFGIGGFGIGGFGIGGGLGYGCTGYGCTCQGLPDCVQMCWETGTCEGGKCWERNGTMHCPW